MLLVRRCSPADVDTCTGIARGLPEYFTSAAADTVRRDLTEFHAWVIADAGRVFGFLVAHVRSSHAAEILWCAVAANDRGHGIGTVLVEHVLDELRTNGLRLVEVKTLDRSVDYSPYEATRVFWERRGFIQIDTVDPPAGWQQGDRAALYVASLQRTA